MSGAISSRVHTHIDMHPHIDGWTTYLSDSSHSWDFHYLGIKIKQIQGL